MLQSPRFASLLALLLLPAVGAPLLAQERPRPRQDIITERIPLFGRVEAFTFRRARLGVVVNPVAAQTDSIGALIQSVTPNGPADRAGIRSGDIIVRINGQSLVEGYVRVGKGQSVPWMAVSLIAAGINAGDSVVVQYQRGKDRRVTTLIAGDESGWAFNGPEGVPFTDVPGDDLRVFGEGFNPDIRMRVESGPPGTRTYTMRTQMPRMFMLGSPLADVELAPLNPALGRYFGVSDGVLVINLPPDTKLGLKPGDVVLSVDGRKVRLPSQLFRVLQSYEPGEEFKLEIMRMKKREVVSGSVMER